MTFIDPTYLRTINDGLISGVINKDNASALPVGLVGMYEEALPPAANLNERKESLEFFAAWALLKKEVSAEFLVLLLEGWTEEDVIEYLGIYSKWFNSPVSGKYVLYHERLRTFILQKASHSHFEKGNDLIIHQCQLALQVKTVDEWERYALEYLSSHIFIKAMKNSDGSALKALAYDTSHWNRQIEVSKGFEWSKSMLNDMMLWASKYDDDQVIECALNKVDLHHMEQNDAPRIVQLVAENDIETALLRLDSFGGNDKRSLRKKLVLYLTSLFRILDEINCGKHVHESQLVFLRNFLTQMDSENKLVVEAQSFLPDKICEVVFNKWESTDYLNRVSFFINGLKRSESKLYLNIESKGYLSPLYLTKQYVINLQIDDRLTWELMNDLERGEYDLVLMKIKSNKILDSSIHLSLLLDISRMHASVFEYGKSDLVMNEALELIGTLFEPERSWALLDLIDVKFINKHLHGSEQIGLEALLDQFNCSDELIDLSFSRFFTISLDLGLWESFLSVLNVYIKFSKPPSLEVLDLPDVYMHLDFKSYYSLLEEFNDDLQKSIEINKAVKYHSSLNNTQHAQELSKKIVYEAYLVASNAHVIVSMLNQGFFDDSFELAIKSMDVINSLDDDGFQELAITAFFKIVHTLFSMEKLLLFIDLLDQPYNRVKALLGISNSLVYTDLVSSKYYHNRAVTISDEVLIEVTKNDLNSEINRISVILNSDFLEKRSFNGLIRLYFKSQKEFYLEMLQPQNEVSLSRVFYHLAIYNAENGNVVESVILFSKINILSLTSEQIDTFFKELFFNSNFSDVLSNLRCYLNLNVFKDFLLDYFEEIVVSNLNDLKYALFLADGFMNVYSSILCRHLSLRVLKSSLSDNLISRSRGTYDFRGIYI